MNLFKNAQPPQQAVDLDELESELHRANQQYAQKPYTPPERYTPLQTIAHAITRLTWHDAERMGVAIQSKQNEEKTSSLAAAIQEWAKDWESFNDV